MVEPGLWSASHWNWVQFEAVEQVSSLLHSWVLSWGVGGVSRFLYLGEGKLIFTCEGSSALEDGVLPVAVTSLCPLFIQENWLGWTVRLW